MIASAALCALAVAALVFFVARGAAVPAAICKMTASTAFLAFAAASGAPANAYGRAIMVALVLSWWGDLLLIPKHRAAFTAGLAAFLLAHVAYALAFTLLGLNFLWTLAASIVLLLAAAPFTRYLRPRLGRMRAPVYAYIAVITLMTAFAAGAYGFGGSAAIPIGALLFYLSDLFVARHRFVAEAPINRIVGLPLYYAGQMLLAYSAAPPPA